MNSMVIVGVVVALGLLLVIFAPMYQLNESLDTLIISNMTANNTPMVAYNGTQVYQMNEIQHFLMANMWLILFVIILIIVIKNVSNRQNI